MKYLLDTCVISEVVKKEPNPAVIRWLDTGDEGRMYLSVLTLGELIKGITKLPIGEKKEKLQSWVRNDLAVRFGPRLVEIDTEIARAWGMLLGEAERRGEKLPVIDSLIAVSASVHDLIVVTRNVQDMARCQAKVFNPWESQSDQ
ncbi:MAG: type II toxin-antitoxin system VapC family toxin [Deltaproteobacteria bacterium]|nr:type II toxin-antitoxin system VapC family toxin [Deltaproteobacteria bacterium]